MSVNNKEWHLDDTINKRNLYVLEILRRYVPSYAKHMFENNRVVEAFYNSTKGGINPMSMPICKTCHRPGVHVKDPAFKTPEKKFDPMTGEMVDKINCYCDLHGITYDTKELRRYLIEDLELNPEIIYKIEMALYEGVKME